MAKEKEIVFIKDLIRHDAAWQCGDCKNIYTFDIKNCPNRVIDVLAVKGVLNNGSR